MSTEVPGRVWVHCAQTARDLDRAIGDIRMRGELEGRPGGLRMREAQGCEARDFLRVTPASVRGMPWRAGRLQEGASVVKNDREGVWCAG